MKNISVSRREFLGASGVTVAAGPAGAKAGSPTAHFNDKGWQKKILD